KALPGLHDVARRRSERFYPLEYRERRKLCLLLHGCVAGILLVLSLLSVSSRVMFLIGGIAGGFSYTLIAPPEAAGSRIIITPLSWWYASLAFSLGVCPIWIGAFAGDIVEINYVSVRLGIDSIASGYLYYTFGALALNVGVQFGRPGRSRSTADI